MSKLPIPESGCKGVSEGRPGSTSLEIGTIGETLELKGTLDKR